MSQDFNSLWFEAALPNQKKILVSQVYREWQCLGTPDSDSIPEQYNRWMNYLSNWEKALNTGLECISMGDFNLNHCNWTDPNVPHSSQTYKLRSLIAALFNRILPLGVSQLVSGPTRFFPGQTPSGLDHIFSNAPEKISSVQKFNWGGSDHMMIIAVRISRSIRSCPNYIRRRSYKYFNPELFRFITRKLGWLDVYLSEDVNIAVSILTNRINEVLDVIAPFKIIQIRKRYNPWMSQKEEERYG